MAQLTLTFDNGPTPGITERVLDVLDDAAVRSTFFVVARDLEQPGVRELAVEAAARGHWIGNHSLTHRVPLGAAADLEMHAQQEIDEAQSLLGDLAHAARWYRPYGAGGILDDRLLSAPAVEHLVAAEMSLVLWTCVPRDWEDPSGWPEVALACTEQTDWSVVVLHDIATGAMDALPRFLQAAHDQSIEVTQEFPVSCVPIDRGRAVGSLDGLVRT